MDKPTDNQFRFANVPDDLEITLAHAIKEMKERQDKAGKKMAMVANVWIVPVWMLDEIRNNSEDVV